MNKTKKKNQTIDCERVKVLCAAEKDKRNTDSE